jgi:hypothetical protein
MSILKQQLINNLINIPGWRTNRKIIVIESDDWGSIRMPSREVYESMLRTGIRVDKCPYNKYDSLASEEDLTSLFDVIAKFHDKNGNHPVITANTIVANPDFKKIEASGFQEYHYEPFPETLKRYPRHERSFEIWKQGIEQKLFWPQFHGREHLNVSLWLTMLKQHSEETMLSFENGLFGISTNITKEKRKSYLAALDFENPSELEWQKAMLADGLELFEKIFGFRSSSYIATNYTWHSDLEPFLANYGIKYIQGSGRQLQPTGNKKIIKKHRLGAKNDWGQIYLTRNCAFEPSENNKKDWISSVLKEIEIAFSWHKPAVISVHRLNFIGYIEPLNRKHNLILFEKLLAKILQRWPEVEFMTTDQLGAMIDKS